MALSLSTRVAPATKTEAEERTGVLDALSPVFAPFAARWAAEADRRRSLRTPANLKTLMEAQRAANSARSTASQARTQRQAARKASANPLSLQRRSARTADKAARRHQAEARARLKAARRNYPPTLARLAIQAHALHAVPSAVATYALSTAQDWTVWPASVSASLVALNAGALWLGRRSVTAVVAEDGASVEERQLMERLDPSYWVQHASDRGLGGTVTGVPRLGDAGITCAVRLDGTWDLVKLRGAEAQVRSLLGMRTSTRLGIKAGDRGGWAEMVFRTRSAVDGASMLWTPESRGLGLDTVTGSVVEFSPYDFRLVAGATGMGKSVLLRPGIAQVMARPDAAVVYLDPKHQEFRLYEGKCRVEHEMPEIYGVTRDLVAEMERRQRESTGTTWVPTPDAPELVVVMDEGAAVVRASKQKPFKDFLDMFEAIATMGRAARIWLTWCTQYPSKEQGIPAQVVEMMLSRAALSVESATADRVIFGENAAKKGYEPSDLGGVPGLAMVRTKVRKSPAPVQTWFVDDERAAQLPAGIVWEKPGRESSDRPALTLVKGQEQPTSAAPATNRDRVLLAVVAGARTPRDVVDATGLNKGTVSRAIRALVSSGALVRQGDGMFTPGEASA